MWWPIYKAPFTSVAGIKYVVEIQQNSTFEPAKVVELTCGVTPFVVSYDTPDMVYTPLRMSGATLTVVTDSYLADLFTPYPQGRRVVLKNVTAGGIEWVGFVTAESFDQDYSNSVSFDFEIDMIDPLSTLEYVKYSTDKKSFVSLLSIAKSCIVSSGGGYGNIYFAAALSKNRAGYNALATNFVDKIFVSEQNFYDEDGQPMTLKEVLQEICNYLSVSCIAYKNDIYFIDYDYIVNGNAKYYKYSGAFYGNESTVYLSDNKTISQIGYKGTGQRLSIQGGYNKASVRSSLYCFSSLYPEIKEANLTQYDSSEMVFGNDVCDKIYCKSLDVKTLQYKYTAGKWSEIPEGEQAKDGNGGVVVKRVNYDHFNRPSLLSWESVVQIKCADWQGSGVTLPESLPVIVSRSYLPVAAYGEMMISIDMDVMFSDLAHGYVPSGASRADDKTNNTEYFYIPVSIRIGDKWYNGTEWVAQKTTMALFTNYKADDHFLYHWLSVRNDNNFLYDTPDLSGKMIRLLSPMPGELELIIYKPHQGWQAYDERYAFIKNVQIRHQVPGSKNQESDRLHELAVNDSYINELDTIDFKVCTRDFAGLSFATPVYVHATGQYRYLDYFYSRSIDAEATAEKLHLTRVANQYKQPKYRLNLCLNSALTPFTAVTDKWLPGVHFMYFGGDIDYKYDNCTVDLVQIFKA